VAEGRFSPLARPALDRRLPGGFAVVLALLVGLQVTAVIRLPKPPRSAAHAGVSVAAPSGRTIMIEDIVHSHLFGLPLAGSAAGPVMTSLTLSGVIAMADPTRGLAIVAADGGAAHVYAVGGQMPGGAKLVEVYRDRVIVDAGGIRQQLQLPRRIGAGGTMLAALPGVADPEAQDAGPEQFASQGFQAKALIDGALPVATGAARILRPQAVVADGQLQGYQVFPTDPDKLGVNSGDELVAVNDTKLTDPEVAARVLKRLDSSSATSVKLTLLHDGQPYDLVVGADALRWHRP
jgi:general secretion pathway protein C